MVVKVISKEDLSAKVEDKKNHDKNSQIKQVKVTKKINYQNGGGNGLPVCQTISLLYMSK